METKAQVVRPSLKIIITPAVARSCIMALTPQTATVPPVEVPLQDSARSHRDHNAPDNAKSNPHQVMEFDH